VARRAAGRRHYNAVRNFRQFWRRMLILRMSPNLGALIRRSGEQKRLAADLGVSRSTICRDVKAILEMGYPCPTCGHFRPRPKTLPEAEAELAKEFGLGDEV
jgi:biotin operon repressor